MCSLWVLMCSFGFNHNYRSDTDCQHRAEFISPRKPPTSGRGLRIFFLDTEAESVSFLCCSLVSPVSTLALSYLVIHPSISRREEEEETGADTVTDKLVLSASTLTWLMNLLTQWLTPENWVTKKSPGRPDVLSYGFLLSSLTLTLSASLSHLHNHQEENAWILTHQKKIYTRLRVKKIELIILIFNLLGQQKSYLSAFFPQLDQTWICCSWSDSWVCLLIPWCPPWPSDSHVYCSHTFLS